MAKLQTTRVCDVDGDSDFKYLINEKDFDPEKHERVRKELKSKDDVKTEGGSENTKGAGIPKAPKAKK